MLNYYHNNKKGRRICSKLSSRLFFSSVVLLIIAAAIIIPLVVDLNDYNAQVLGDQNAEEVIITYHESQLDADTGFNALASPYTINDEETIYVRVEVEDGDPFVTACFISNINFIKKFFFRLLTTWSF